jgi:hypothetical protein
VLLSSSKDLEIHLFDSHDLNPKNFSLSRGFSERRPHKSRRSSDRVSQNECDFGNDADSDATMVDGSEADDLDTETLHTTGADGWDAGTLHDEVDENDWEDVSGDDLDDYGEVGLAGAMGSPVVHAEQVVVRPLKRKFQSSPVFPKHKRLIE